MPRGCRSRVYLGRLSYRATARDVERFFKGFGEIVDIQLKNGYGFVDFAEPRDAEDAVYEKHGRDLCGERVIVECARGTPHGRDLDRDKYRPGKRRSHSRSRSRSPQKRRRRSRSPIRRRSRSRSPRRRSPPPRRRSPSPVRRRSPSRSVSRSPSRSRSRSRSLRRSRSPSPRRDKIQDGDRTGWRLDVENLSAKTTVKDLKEHCEREGKINYAEITGSSKGFVEFNNQDDMLDAVRALEGSELLGATLQVFSSGSHTNNNGTNGKTHSRSPSRSRSRSNSGSRSRSASPQNNGNYNNDDDESDGDN